MKYLLSAGLCLGLLGGPLNAGIIQGFDTLGTIAPGSAGAGYTAPGACVAGGANELQNEATYAVTPNANDCHSAWHAVLPHDGPNFLAVNGNTSVGSVYEQTEGGLTIGNTYSLSAYFSGLYTSNAANITWNLLSGGTVPANTFQTNLTGAWDLNGVTFVATATSVTFSISINTSQASGNDFGLDSISLDEVPEPSTFGLFGMGAAVLLGLGRRRKK